MPRHSRGQRSNGFEPPPSSMLATHVKPGNGVPRLDQDNFAQLLEESLGQDENGQPNLNDDADLNHKLILVIVQAGFEPILMNDRNDPFRSNRISGRSIQQVKQCLAVLQLVVTRTHRILFRPLGYDVERTTPGVPLYVLMIPKLLSLVGKIDEPDIVRAIFEVLSVTASATSAANTPKDNTIVKFLQHCLTSLVNAVSNTSGIVLTEDIILDGGNPAHDSELTAHATMIPPTYFASLNVGQSLLISSLLASFLLQRTTTKDILLQTKKQSRKLQLTIDCIPKTVAIAPQFERLQMGSGRANVSFREESSFEDSMNDDEWPDGERLRKRPRLSTDQEQQTAEENVEQTLVMRLNQRIIGQKLPDFDGLGAALTARMRLLSEADQAITLNHLSQAGCQLMIGTADETSSCPVCDDGEGANEDHSTSKQVDELIKAMISLRQTFQRRKSLRLLALSTLGRLLSHTNSAEHLQLKASAGGEWCMQSLRTTSRELKLVAARMLQSFVRGTPSRDTTMIHENRVTALEYLNALWIEGDPSLQEAVILSLTQMARVVEDDELNIILLRLVDYLGHRNAYISGTVYSELQQLAQHLQTGIGHLLRPFWRTLAVVTVKNFAKRPEIAHQLSDLLGVQVDGLLQIIEEHALPHLVLNRDRKLIERIGASSSSVLSPFDICTKPHNLPRILAFLLSQAFPEPEQTIMAHLISVSEEFREQDLAGWINHAPMQTACELLESIGDAGQGKASKTYQGFQYLAQISHKRSGSNSGVRKSDYTALFLESNALAIVTRFTGKLNEGAVRETNVEKRRCLVALGEIVKLGKSRVKIALPHICACLRSAIDDKALSNAAFLAWNTMMLNLDEDEMQDLISQTFANIVKSWDLFDTKTQELAYDLIANLLKQHSALIRDIFETLPSLASIPLMSKFEAEIATLKHQKDERHQIIAFVDRLRDENGAVVEQALQEFVPVLRQKHDFLHKAILREQPEVFVEDVERAILDACVKFSSNERLILFAAQCLGAVGCLDPSKVENVREKKRFVLTSNFSKAEETTAFLMFFMEQILVEEYVSTSNLREKGFLAWSLQQLLAFCDLPSDIATRGRGAGLDAKDKHWFDLSDTTRLVLTPFLTSRFVSSGKRQKANISYPFFEPGMSYKHWLTEVTLDFLNRGAGDNVDMIFDICCRLVVYGQSTSISAFLLPYAALHLVLSGTEKDKSDVLNEISTVLLQSLNGLDLDKKEQVRLCSQSVFDVLDYMSVWLQETRKQVAQARIRNERGITDPLLERGQQQIEHIAPILSLIPPKVTTQRAIECKSYARALFHQEQYINSLKEVDDADYRRLQDIYAEIDEPDGIEGISAQIKFLHVESEVMEHKKAGRWNTAQSWYEMQLIAQPDDFEVQMNLMKCLKESGQHDVLIHHFDGILAKSKIKNQSLLPYAIEAAWVTNRWDKLSDYLDQAPRGEFSVDLGKVMIAVKNGNQEAATSLISTLFGTSASELTPNNTSSFQASHESLLKMHVLDDVRMMTGAVCEDRAMILTNINQRLGVLGSYVADKQYTLGIQRAIMHLKPAVFLPEDIAGSWLTSARLARKAQATNQAFNSVLRASLLGDKSAAIEQAKLMWQEGHHRKAIQTLEGAIESGALGARPAITTDPTAMTAEGEPEERNEMTAKAFVLLGKWLDQAGQTQSDTIIKTFRKSTEQNRRWEKGWYNLGRHYNKILDSEKLKTPGKESQPYLTGEIAKLVIDNFLRALATGNKYLFQTLPKVLTLWLELVASSHQEHDSRRGNTQFHAHNAAQRKKIIEDTNASVKKYMDRIPVYALYTILPQLVARICHTDQMVNNILQMMIVKVVRSFPQQALWTVLATVKSSSKDRATRGLSVIRKTVENAKKDLKVFTLPEMREFITASQKFLDELLRIADFEIQGRVAQIRLGKDLGFNHKIAPSKLVVPCEACLTPNIPSNNEISSTKGFRPFAKEPITIDAFLDEARVLPSLQKPRKLMIRGSDGKIYSVLAKPHDDLRKDQRLMEFDTMINRFLKRDINASKRRLYIRTYAVVPLNEECGLIEWVDGLKTMRDILLDLYRQRGVVADYAAIREQLDTICTRSDNKASDFFSKVQSRFPPMLRQWFIESFPDPTTWFNARLRYTRSCAVMSMVGHVLGLGDRHGENILFEQGNGGILHVDFNCLFDKGLTFDKPEMVPFRLTHNMIDAFGPYKVDGPYRRSCEITLSLLRSNEDGLMTILETFLHDPTTDFMTAGKKRKTNAAYLAGDVPDTPERMLEGVRGKVRGMLAGESVPLSVGGYVEEMIRRASDGENLAKMYIGWCAFF